MMNNNEITVQQLIVNDIVAPKIECNFEEINKDLDLVLEQYDGLLVGEYDIKPAKKIKANLNKLKTAINDKKKDVKKLVNKEYTPFELEVKKLMAKIDNVNIGIDSQLKDYEAKRIEERYAFLEAMIEDLVGDLDVAIYIDDHQDWLNASYSNKKVKDEIVDICEYFKKNMKALELLNTEFKDDLVEVLVNGGGMAEVLQEKTRLEMQHARFKEIEEAKKQEEARQDELVKETSESFIANEKQVTFTLKITCSLSQGENLSRFIKDNNIEIERIK